MSGWRKRQIEEKRMNDKQELFTIKWSQTYDLTSLAELMEEILMGNEYKEANEVIDKIKSKL